jgi:hypothetical protein
VINNLPSNLTGVLVRDSDTQLSFSITGQAISHEDLNDVDNVSISFVDAAFETFLANDVSNSSKSDLKINFNDPNSFGMYPVRDTTLDNLNVNYNYGISNSHFIGGGSFVLIEFDLT